MPAEDDETASADNGGKQPADSARGRLHPPPRGSEVSGAPAAHRRSGGSDCGGYPASWTTAEVAAHKAGDTALLQRLQAERLQQEFLQVSLGFTLP